MEKTFKTHDGVEVIKGEYGWACYKSGKAALGGKDTPTPTKILYSKIDDDKFLFFSSEPACQAYIDSMNQSTCTPDTDINPHLGELLDECRTPTAKKPVISVSMYNKAGEKIMTSEVCEFETGVHDGGLSDTMHNPIFEFTNETGKPITIKEGQRIAWKDGRVMLIDVPEPNGQMATENKWAKMVSDANIEPPTPDLHQLLSQFSHAYNIPINTVLEFIVNQKSK
jgi:hypothetical protein